MIEQLRVIESYDMIFFTPHEEEDDQTTVTAGHYKDAGTNVTPGIMGAVYDIILFRLDEEGAVDDLERFDGVLIEPREYISRLLKEQWYGLVARKTTTSDSVVSDVYKSWDEME